jgi:hypothetical protein
MRGNLFSQAEARVAMWQRPEASDVAVKTEKSEVKAV